MTPHLYAWRGPRADIIAAVQAAAATSGYLGVLGPIEMGSQTYAIVWHSADLATPAGCAAEAPAAWHELIDRMTPPAGGVPCLRLPPAYTAPAS